MTTYYVSSNIGNNDNAGTSESVPLAGLRAALSATAPCRTPWAVAPRALGLRVVATLTNVMIRPAAHLSARDSDPARTDRATVMLAHDHVNTSTLLVNKPSSSSAETIILYVTLIPRLKLMST